MGGRRQPGGPAGGRLSRVNPAPEDRASATSETEDGWTQGGAQALSPSRSLPLKGVLAPFGPHQTPERCNGTVDPPSRGPAEGMGGPSPEPTSALPAPVTGDGLPGANVKVAAEQPGVCEGSLAVGNPERPWARPQLGTGRTGRPRPPLKLEPNGGCPAPPRCPGPQGSAQAPRHSERGFLTRSLHSVFLSRNRAATHSFHELAKGVKLASGTRCGWGLRGVRCLLPLRSLCPPGPEPRDPAPRCPPDPSPALSCAQPATRKRRCRQSQGRRPRGVAWLFLRLNLPVLKQDRVTSTRAKSNAVSPGAVRKDTRKQMLEPRTSRYQTEISISVTVSASCCGRHCPLPVPWTPWPLAVSSGIRTLRGLLPLPLRQTLCLRGDL